MAAHVPTDRPANVNADWLERLSAWGWREIVLILAVLLGLYVALAFYRLRRIGHPPAVAEKPAATIASGGRAVDPFIAPPPPVSTAREVPLDAYEADLPWVKSPVTNEEQRRLEIIEREMVSMRGQLDVLRETVNALADELRGEISRHLAPAEASPLPSPIYGDAMQMAMAGHDAATISEHCGIARAEAELVVALAQQSRQADEREDDGRQTRY